ncbi:hypothetical protein HYDPIDRAFT_97727, partial [Hydnomerulius pinastri MD-312]
KYPLAMVNKALQVLSDRLLIGYNIGCKLSIMIASSPLNSQFSTSQSCICVNAFHGYSHNYRCQDTNHPNVIQGAGLEDFGTMKCMSQKSGACAKALA